MTPDPTSAPLEPDTESGEEKLQQQQQPTTKEEEEATTTTITTSPSFLNSTDILSSIFRFFSIKELSEVLSKVSRQWCIEATKTENEFWKDPNRVITFSNIMFDAKTGDVLLDFNRTDFVSFVFSQILKHDLQFSMPTVSSMSSTTSPPSSPSSSSAPSPLTIHSNMNNNNNNNTNTTTNNSKLLTLLYTSIPYEYQNLDIVTNTKRNNNRQSTKYQSSSSSSPASSNRNRGNHNNNSGHNSNHYSSTMDNNQLQQHIRESISSQYGDTSDDDTSSSSVDGQLIKTHLFPVAPTDMTAELSFSQTNYSFLYLHDGRFIFILLGNNVSCFDMIGMTQIWHIHLYDKRTPKFLFVNMFSQNSRYVFVALPQDVFCIEKRRGTKFNLMSMVLSLDYQSTGRSNQNKTGVKKRERVKDLEVDDHMVVIVTGDNLIVNTGIDFTDVQIYARHHMDIQKDKISGLSGGGGGGGGASPVHNNNMAHMSIMFSNYQLSRKKTLLNMGLDAPKLLLFDGDNNFLTSALCKNKDRHNVLMKKSVGSLPPYFCLVNDSERELRVINKDGQRIHILNVPSTSPPPPARSTVNDNYNEPIDFTYQAKRYLLQGDFGSERWYLIHPESGIVTDLSHLGVKHDRLFVVENAEGSLLGLLSLSVKGKKIVYWERVEPQATNNDESSQQQQQPECEFKVKWTSEMLWKESFYKFELDGACRFYYDKRRHYFIITRTVSDSRRFLSKEQRLDVELSVYESAGGKLLWKKQVECYTGNDPYAEKGFHIKTNNKQLFVMSYFVPVSPKRTVVSLLPTTPTSTGPSSQQLGVASPSKSSNSSNNGGTSVITAFNIETGNLDFTHKHKRKVDLLDHVLQHILYQNLNGGNKTFGRLVDSGSAQDLRALMDTSEPSENSHTELSPRVDSSPRNKTKKPNGNRKDKKEKCAVQ